MKRVITEMQQFTDAITENRNNALDNIQHGKQEAANTHTSLKKITTQQQNRTTAPNQNSETEQVITKCQSSLPHDESLGT